IPLLREQPEVAPRREQPLEQLLGLLETALQGQIVGEPERAREECTLARRQAVDALVLVVAGIAVDESVAVELSLDRGDRAHHPGVVRRQEADERDDEQAGVEPLRTVRLREGVELAVEAALEHLALDLVAHLPPALDRPGALELLDRLDAPVERDPGHHLRVREVAATAADLPDPVAAATMPPVGAYVSAFSTISERWTASFHFPSYLHCRTKPSQ